MTVNLGKSLDSAELNSRQVYIHSKLMMIDDAFFTLGSANLNVRSMAADSEINMATDDHAQARALRQRMWALQAGGFGATGGGNGTPADIALAFDDWKKVMVANLKAQKNNARMSGFIISFEELREINFRVA